MKNHFIENYFNASFTIVINIDKTIDIFDDFAEFLNNFEIFAKFDAIVINNKITRYCQNDEFDELIVMFLK